MDPDRLAKAKRIFDTAVGKSSQERERILRDECGDDEQLRALVSTLLGEHDQGLGAFLALPTVRESRARTDDGPQAQIGRYRLLQKIGEGGFGEVYEAEQTTPVRRRVALKVLKAGLDTKVVLARFEAERQALALMDHAHIAKVFDAGETKQGRPYFVMEHVPGVAITEHCDRQRLGIRERVELFVHVCEAVQHAHQKAIIHRDIKPSNILVTAEDGKLAPKIIDFGIAKATALPLTERTLFTELGQLIGTPAYMSPEQAEMTTQGVDVRTDVYSLGAVLYELLVGAPPFDPGELRQAGFERILSILRNEEPSEPSRRVSSPSEESTSTAHKRRSEPARLTGQLRGDLDWITMKALEKDRTRRYDSASELASDLTRYLRDEPVLAGPPSNAYRISKFAKKYRGLVAATAAVLVVIMAFGSLSFWQARKARTQAARVQANAILASAASAQDPLVKALLISELDGFPRLTKGQLSQALDVLGTPLPVAALGNRGLWAQWRAGTVTASLSPDGTHVVTGDVDGVARVFRADGGGETLTLEGDARELYCVGFSPDGKHVFTGGWDRTLRIWRTDGSEPMILRGHEGPVLAAAFSRDGKRIVTASEDGTSRIWSVGEVGEPTVLRGHTDRVRSASFDPDGTGVVTASRDGTARVWKADGSGTPLILRGHEKGLLSAQYSPDGTRIVTASEDGTARVWSPQTFASPTVLRGHGGALRRAVFSPDGTQIVTASADGTARVWPADGIGEPFTLDGHEGELWWADFSADGSRIITASEDGTARIWEPFVPVPSSTGILQRSMPAEPYRGKRIRFRAKVRVESRDGGGRAQMWVRVDRDRRRLEKGFFDNMYDRPIISSQWSEYEIVGDVADDAVKINVGLLFYSRTWMDAASLEIMDEDVATGKILDDGFETDPLEWEVASRGYRARLVEENPTEGRRCVLLERHGERAYRSTILATPDRGVRVATFADRGNVVMTSPNDGTARVWQANGNREPVVLEHGDGIYSASFSPDGQRILTGSEDGTARVWTTDGTGEPVVLKGHEDGVGGAAFSPDGQRILTASWDGTARIWTADGTGEPVVLEHEDGIYSAAFSPDGQRILTGSADGTARVWTADGAGEPVVLEHEDGVGSAAFSPDGQRVVTASHDGTARVWRADGTGKPVILKGHKHWIISVAFSPDGQRVVTASYDGTARVWQVDGTGEPVVLKGHEGRIESAAFSPDGQRVVTASYDGTARVWRVDGTGGPVVLRGHEDVVGRAVFSPDGQRVVTASWDGTARVWTADGIGEPVVLKGHEDWIASAAFSPDGQRVVTASGDGTARVWRVTWEGIFGYLRESLTWCLTPEERTKYLLESPSKAWERYVECENQHGRNPTRNARRY